MIEWKTVPLDELVTTGKIELGRGNIISKNDIEQCPGNYPIYSSSASTEGKFGEYGKFMFDEELISWSVDGGGYFFYRPRHKFSVTNVSGYLRVKNQEFNYRFLYYSLALQHRYLTFDYTSKAHPSVIRKLYSIPTIPKVTQNKIATILSTTDKTIKQTEILIEKYKQVKSGMMHDLFTRGVLPDGSLRPFRDEAPELYKESSIGWIPKEWTLTDLGHIASFQRGHDIVEADFHVGDIPVVSSSGIIGYHDTATTRAPNVVVGRKGTIGKVHFITSDFWAHDTSLYVTDFHNNFEKYVFFLCTNLNLSRYGTRSGSPSLNRNDIHPIPLGVPTIEEQKMIVKRLDTIDTKIDTNFTALNKLISLRSGLMQDLLTGKVPVKTSKGEVS